MNEWLNEKNQFKHNTQQVDGSVLLMSTGCIKSFKLCTSMGNNKILMFDVVHDNKQNNKTIMLHKIIG